MVIVAGIVAETIFLVAYSRRASVQTDNANTTLSPTMEVHYVNNAPGQPLALGTFSISTEKNMVVFAATVTRVFKQHDLLYMDAIFVQNGQQVSQTFIVLPNASAKTTLRLQDSTSMAPISTNAKIQQMDLATALQQLPQYVGQNVYLMVNDESNAPNETQIQNAINAFMGNDRACTIQFVQAFANNTVMPTCTPILSGISVYVKDL